MIKQAIIDVLMAILLILEYSKVHMPAELHEIIGILLAILVVMHLIYNRKYLKSISVGRYNRKRKILTVANIMLVITFSLTVLNGLMSSQMIVLFNIGNITTIYLHKISAYVLLILVAVHLGFNMENMNHHKKHLNINKHVMHILEVIIVVLGIYCFIHVDYCNHLTGNMGFSAINGNILINFLEYACILMAISLVVYHVNNIIE